MNACHRRLLFALGLGAVLSTSASSLTLVNPGFEEDVVNDGQFNSTITPFGWSTYDPAGILARNYNDVGVLNPTDTVLYPDDAPEGSNVALIFLYPQSYHPGDFDQPVGLQQTLADTLQASTRYELSVQVGNIAHDGSGSYSLNGFPGYQVQLLAGGTVLAQDNNTLAPAEGTFALSTVSFTPTGAHTSLLGQALSIRLINLNIHPTDTPNESGIEVNFDDVRLTAAAVPEPAAFSLAVASLALAAASCRRRRSR